MLQCRRRTELLYDRGVVTRRSVRIGYFVRRRQIAVSRGNDTDFCRTGQEQIWGNIQKRVCVADAYSIRQDYTLLTPLGHITPPFYSKWRQNFVQSIELNLTVVWSTSLFSIQQDFLLPSKYLEIPLLLFTRCHLCSWLHHTFMPNKSIVKQFLCQKSRKF